MNNQCKHINCSEINKRGFDYCEYHFDWGAFGKGEFYEQYQIIEKDFIDFIKVVPIDEKKHHSVYSPYLRDIIIRTCVQIEIFLKEWGLYCIVEDSNHCLWKEYNKNGKKERNWSFGDYFVFKNEINSYSSIYVRPLGGDINPFEDWISKNSLPKWWNAYNSIKHSGIKAKEDANLENSLYALAALFQLHCSNLYSRNYLKSITSNKITRSVNHVYVQFENITTPVDSKQYLFKYNLLGGDKKIELVTLKQFENSNKKRL